MKKKTHEEYVEELAIKNPTIEVIGEYIGASIKIRHKCLIDGYEWDATPHNILRGRGCPTCAGHIKKAHDEYVKELSLINSNIVVLGKYINYNTPILHKCIIHNVEWEVKPNHILKGHGCRQCGNDLLRAQKSKEHDNYVEELQKTNSNIIVLEKYINAHTPILHKCLVDGYEWCAKPNNILNGKGCPECNESFGERQIRQWLNSRHIAYEPQKIFEDCCDIKPLPFDFYLPNDNVAIEYDGEQHYRPIDYFGGQKSFEYTIKHDNIKNEYCKNNGIPLLRIPYFKNVEEELNNFLFI